MIVVFTRADASNLPALIAKQRVEEFAAEMLSKLRASIESQLSGCKYPPKAYLSMDSELWIDLILC